jgi:hypothetical protein
VLDQKQILNRGRHAGKEQLGYSWLFDKATTFGNKTKKCKWVVKETNYNYSYLNLPGLIISSLKRISPANTELLRDKDDLSTVTEVLSNSLKFWVMPDFLDFCFFSVVALSDGFSLSHGSFLLSHLESRGSVSSITSMSS